MSGHPRKTPPVTKTPSGSKTSSGTKLHIETRAQPGSHKASAANSISRMNQSGTSVNTTPLSLIPVEVKEAEEAAQPGDFITDAATEKLATTRVENLLTAKTIWPLSAPFRPLVNTREYKALNPYDVKGEGHCFFYAVWAGLYVAGASDTLTGGDQLRLQLLHFLNKPEIRIKYTQAVGESGRHGMKTKPYDEWLNELKTGDKNCERQEAIMGLVEMLSVSILVFSDLFKQVAYLPKQKQPKATIAIANMANGHFITLLPCKGKVKPKAGASTPSQTNVAEDDGTNPATKNASGSKRNSAIGVSSASMLGPMLKVISRTGTDTSQRSVSVSSADPAVNTLGGLLLGIEAEPTPQVNPATEANKPGAKPTTAKHEDSSSGSPSNASTEEEKVKTRQIEMATKQSRWFAKAWDFSRVNHSRDLTQMLIRNRATVVDLIFLAYFQAMLYESAGSLS